MELLVAAAGIGHPAPRDDESPLFASAAASASRARRGKRRGQPSSVCAKGLCQVWQKVLANWDKLV